MKKIRDVLSRPAVTAALFILAVALLFGGTVGGARAALSKYSEMYDAQFNMEHIGLALLENDDPVSGNGALLSGFLAQSNNELLPGFKYDEVLKVQNTGSIDQYVRATVYKYWLDKNGDKAYDMNSDWIDVHFVTGNGWEKDAASSTGERTVLYYSKALTSGEISPEFVDTVKVLNNVVYHVTQSSSTSNGVTTITTTFDYDGCQLCLMVIVDAVQTHNAKDAIKSAWGQDIAVTGIS